MQLYLIRHGESANNALGVGDISYEDYMAQRSPDPPLTQIGKRQARLVAHHLAADTHPETGAGVAVGTPRAGYGITDLYCSPMLRALQTAQPIGEVLALRPQVWVDIHEHGGLFHGNPRADGDVRAYPGLTGREIDADFPGYLVPSEVTQAGWWAQGYEEIEQCEERAVRVAEQITARAATEEDRVLALVSHGTFSDRLLKALLQQSGRRDFYFFHYNTAITRIDFIGQGRLQLRYTNRTQHLPPELITK